MEVATVTLDRRKARDMYRAYKSHKAYERPEDYQIMRAYQLIAQGRTVIQAMKSIKDAGLYATGLPKLSICRANAMWCYLKTDNHGNGSFSGKSYNNWNNKRDVISWKRQFFPEHLIKMNSWQHCKAGNTVKPLFLLFQFTYGPSVAWKLITYFGRLNGIRCRL